MGLIKEILKKAAGVGVIIAGLPLGTVGLGASIPVYNKMGHLQDDLKEVNNQSKLVCALNDKLANELEQLNSSTLNMGDYVVTSSLDEDKQQKYAQIYDHVINSIGKLETEKIISKEEFVDYMTTNGEAIENYINSEEFNGKLSEVKSILLDETKTTEEKVLALKETINLDDAIFDEQYKTYNRVEIASLVFMIFGGLATFMSAWVGLGVLPDAAESWKGVVNGLVVGLLGVWSGLGWGLITGFDD